MKLEKLRPIMFVGTGSDVGKSVINAGFCRIFRQDGFNPAPFKAQNMSLNSFATPDGLEIGRAQAVQAEACGIPCRVEMNPILLKPTGNAKSQIVLNGKPWANKTAKEYFIDTDRNFLFSEAMNAFTKLEQEFNPIVAEGAGSISEINLWDKDITNMRVAIEKDAATYLIADIDKGGVFGSLYGSLQLLPEAERKQISGIIINKFRGDISLFKDGIKILEELCKVPVVGVIPYFRDIYIDDEDSVVIEKKRISLVSDKTNIAVVLLPHMSNFTDFNFLEKLPEINLFYAAQPEDLEQAEIVILPGSKNTISDMLYLKKTGMATAVCNSHKTGKAVYGICGGFQIMGEWINDPKHVEGEIERVPGLGILPVETILTEEKITRQCTFEFLDKKCNGSGYEIHMGHTFSTESKPTFIIDGVKNDGCFLDEKTWGTYIHGIFDNEEMIMAILKASGKSAAQNMDYNQFKDEQYDKLAKLIRENIDLEKVYSSMRKQFC